ncbi:MAG: DUF4112 domain-containing protein [Oleibacter sp.]|nr:DUF4112 domain-containing protein [Thalassolituus sp.]
MLNNAETNEHLIKKLERFSRFTDSSIGIPFTRFRMGFDSLVGFIPGIGDSVGLALSLYPIYLAMHANAGFFVIARMLFNIGLDFLVGLIPLLGDVFDIYFKANIRNTAILKRHLNVP